MQLMLVVIIFVSIPFVPVHFDLPVGVRGQRDPVDLSSVVAAVNTTEDHLTALCTVAIRGNNKQMSICKFNVT